MEGSYIINSMDRQVFPLLLPNIRSELGFTLPETGLQATIYTLGLGLSGFAGAFLLLRFKPKWVLIIAILVYSAATALQAAAFGFGDLLTYRIISGFGEGIQVAALNSAIGLYLVKYRTLMLGTLNSAFGVGGFIGPLIGGIILTNTGLWRVPLWLFAALGIVFMIVLIFAMPGDFGSFSRGATVSEEGVETPEVSARTAVMRAATPIRINRTVVGAALVAIFSGFSEFTFIGLFPTYLEGAHGFTPGQAGLAASMFGVGALIGIPGAWLGDRFGTRRIEVVTFVLSLITGALTFTVTGSVGIAAVVGFVQGVVLSGFAYANAQALVQRSFPREHIGFGSGIAVMVYFIPGAVSGYILGVLRDATSWSIAGTIVMVVYPVLGLLALLLVREHQLVPQAPRKTRQRVALGETSVSVGGEE